MNKALLIVFVKNIISGKTKTRLASTIGNEAALEVYNNLLEITETETSQVSVERRIYYSNTITENRWKSDQKGIQKGNDLGEKMLNAFKNGFDEGYKKVVLIGSDLPEINKTIINSAFNELKNNEVVFGPAQDGGYYLIGLSKMHSFIFKNKPWSTSTLLNKTLEELNTKKVNVSLLKTLNDIDTFEDLKQYPKFLKLISHHD